MREDVGCSTVEVDGMRLRELRERRVLSQGQLAERAGVGRNTINRLEGGRLKARPSTLQKIAGALGVDPEELVRMEEAGR